MRSVVFLEPRLEPRLKVKISRPLYYVVRRKKKEVVKGV